MAFPLGFFQALVHGSLVLAALGAVLLISLFVFDSVQRRIW